MPVHITRKNIFFQPDSKRIIARFFYISDERSIKIIQRVLHLTDDQQKEILAQVLRGYSKRHRSIVSIFEKHFNRLSNCFKSLNIDPNSLNLTQKLVIGSYFTMEYSIEAAAFFNPSIVEDLDQTQLADGEKRIILSFRATGEGHVSSIVFRSAIIDANLHIRMEHVGNMLDKPSQIKNHIYHKKSFLKKLKEMHCLYGNVYDIIADKLTDTFTYEELKRYVEETKTEIVLNQEGLVFLREIMWLASSHYEMTFSLDTSLSERVIFPIADTEKRGIEDARFVKFTDDDGSIIYYASYTAYDGVAILPKLLITSDFYHFQVLPFHGEIAQNKGIALFPRKINGKYAMLCRIDGENNYIAFSDTINVWREPAKLIQTPEHPWEFVQLGNCGSPLETKDGWLVITHGVGPMREYVLGASLFDLEHPVKEIGRMTIPLLSPNDHEREGYVPNVVYSCGSIIHNGHVVLPYAMSDCASTYATIPVDDLLQELRR
ncbi:glycoside hydrolase family 130 protein [Olivibacter ginsenosidimutans]|uniref:Glycoside hydrolase family 130 protein n=1 Tax=Olivibacter ginsenosidimutans TaxID=1176537 RepID=A0ABP9AY77_9SPHI